MGLLDRITGPECPDCGCEDSTLLKSRRGWDDRVRQRRQCANRRCGRVWLAAVEDHPDDDSLASVIKEAITKVVDFIKTRCPYCDSTNTTVYCTRPKVRGIRERHHRCAACKKTFKSLER